MRNFWHNDSGQSLVFAAMTFFCIMAVALIILGVAEGTSAQTEVQYAADTACYASHQVLADSVSQIAWINETMASVYYNAMRYAVDTATLGTLSEFKNPEPMYGTIGQWATLFNESPAVTAERFMAPDNLIGISDVVDRYNEAYARADEWIPRAEEWLKRLSRIQRGIAVLAPEAVKGQLAYTAVQNGAERFAFYPGFILIPREPQKRTCTLERIPGGWEVSSDTDSYRFSAVHAEPQYFDNWMPDPLSPEEERLGSDGVDDSVLDVWNIEMEEIDQDSVSMEVRGYYRLGASRDDWRAFPARWEIYTTVGDRNIFDLIIAQDRNNVTHYHEENGAGGEVVHEQDDIQVIDSPEGTIYIVNGTYMRQRADGRLEGWDDVDQDGEVDSDEWVELPDTMNVDGVEIPIDYGINLSINYPIRIRIRNATITLVEPVAIHFNTPVGWVRVQDGYATINGLSTRGAHDKWRRVYAHGHNYDETSSRTYHRMLEIVPEDIENDQGEWRYEWVRVGSYMQDMEMETFALHGLMDNDPYYQSNADSASRHVLPKSDADSLWNDFPAWSRPNRLAEVVADALSQTAPQFYGYGYGGWFDIAAGKPVSYSGKYTAYSQTRECWFCDHMGVGGDTLKDHFDSGEFQPSPTAGEDCMRPAGFFYYDAGTPAHQAEVLQWLNEELNSNYFRTNGGRPGFGGTRAVAVPDRPNTVQIVCPVCARKFCYESNLFALGSSSREWVQGPPFQHDPINFAKQKSFVRKYLTHALGRFDVANRPANPFNRTLRDEDRMSVTPAQSYNTNHWQPAMALTSEFFRKGMTIAVWKETAASRIYNILGGRSDDPAEARAGINNPFPTAAEMSPHTQSANAWNGASSSDQSKWMWGHFGIATSRLVFWNDSTEHVAPERDISFSWDGTRPTWITEPDDEIDILGRPINWYREEWVRSGMNLFDPDWDARLVNARDVLDLRDIYLDEDYDESGEVPDTKLSFLFSEMARESWPANIIDIHRVRSASNYRNPEWAVRQYWNHISAPPLMGNNAGRSVNYNDEDFENVYRH